MKPKTKFREYCKEHNLTAAMVAKKTGLSRRTIEAYFIGVRSPNIRSRRLIKEKLGVEIYKIFD